MLESLSHHLIQISSKGILAYYLWYPTSRSLVLSALGMAHISLLKASVLLHEVSHVHSYPVSRLNKLILPIFPHCLCFLDL